MKKGLHSVGAATEGTYVDEYMLGHRIELHSIIADLWVNFGLVGFGLGAMMVAEIFRSLLRRLAAGAVPALVTLLSLVGIWDLFFSPLASNLMHLILAVALALQYKGQSAEPERGLAPRKIGDHSRRDVISSIP